ncbi:hypothetical protein ALC60_14820 [Trachymyrmex zeteki]|uniref:Uncharacterized protein n=1 Tax=Mycetomoellerius zeteki TaxID=64791 RepID=A0A151WEE8_9HYME|nr:hypothetical protein ALC60_14820 [Trachymyrmex zeteki]
MDSTKDIVERERTVKLIAKTRASIRKKHRVLKTGMMENEIALKKQFKSIVKQIVENTERDKSIDIMEKKRKNKRERDDDDDDDDDDEISTQIISQRPPWNKRTKRLNVMSTIHYTPIESQQLSPQDEEVFIGDDPSLETSVRQVLKTPQGRERYTAS